MERFPGTVANIRKQSVIFVKLLTADMPVHYIYRAVRGEGSGKSAHMCRLA